MAADDARDVALQVGVERGHDAAVGRPRHVGEHALDEMRRDERGRLAA